VYVRPEPWAFFQLPQFDISAKSAQADNEGAVGEMAGPAKGGQRWKWKFRENATPKIRALKGWV